MQMPPPPVRLQRARGRVEVAVALRDGAIRLARLHQEGCAKAILPRTAAAIPEVVLINTAGGLTGGDRLELALEARAGAALVATGQAAERVYRATPDAAPARLAVRLRLGPGAALDWLPQETILFQGGRLARLIEVDMAADATLTLLETLTLGRAAMGETVAAGLLADHWRIRREGRLVHAEALRLGDDVARAAAGPATLGGARALATLVHVAPDAGLRLAAVRARLPAGPDVLGAAGLKGDALILRLVGRDLAPLRAALAACLTALRRAPCPRVWTL
jgi:urease accessory protein